MRTVSELPFLDNNNVPGLDNGAAEWLSLRGDGYPTLSSSEGYVNNLVFCIEP